MTTKRALDEGVKRQAVALQPPVLSVTLAFGHDEPYRMILECQPDWFPGIFAKVLATLDEGEGLMSFVNIRDTLTSKSAKELVLCLTVLSHGDEWRNAEFERDDDDSDDDDELQFMDRDSRRARIQEYLDAGKHDKIDFVIPAIRQLRPYKTDGPCYHVVVYRA
jgi:hypothetical protein